MSGSLEKGHDCLSLITNAQSGKGQASYAKNQIDIPSVSCGGGLFLLCTLSLNVDGEQNRKI